nr:MAG TPA: hypothetical protein [Caudoviricetes sp.]
MTFATTEITAIKIFIWMLSHCFQFGRLARTKVPNILPI